MSKNYLSYVRDDTELVFVDENKKSYSFNNLESGMHPVLGSISTLDSCVCSTNEPGLFKVSIEDNMLDLLKRNPSLDDTNIFDASIFDENKNVKTQVFLQNKLDKTPINSVLVYENFEENEYVYEFDQPINRNILDLIKKNKSINAEILTPARLDDVEKKFGVINSPSYSWWKKYVDYPIHSSTDSGMAKNLNLSILDYGIDIKHRAFNTSFAKIGGRDVTNDQQIHKLCHTGILGYDIVGSDFCPSIETEDSHGTKMTGLIAADWDRTDSMIPGIPFKSFKVINKSTTPCSNIIAGLEKAIKNGAKLINVSMLLDWSQRPFKRIFNDAKKRGVIIVAAAGNDGRNLDEQKKNYGFSLYEDNLISVTAIRPDSSLLSVNFGSSITIAAPGVGLGSPVNNGGFSEGVGMTSGATALVTGAAALFLCSAKHKNITPKKLVGLLQNNSSFAHIGKFNLKIPTLTLKNI